MSRAIPEGIKDYLNYNPDTGIFTWKKRVANRVKVGDLAGHKQGAGYIATSFKGNRVYLHRAAFLLMGQPIPGYVDHINGIKDDNRWSNLRPCNNSENLRNSKKPSHNTSGVKGVSWNKSRSKWESYIKSYGSKIHLGYYDCIANAIQSKKYAEEKYHGEFQYGKP